MHLRFINSLPLVFVFLLCNSKFIYPAAFDAVGEGDSDVCQKIRNFPCECVCEADMPDRDEIVI